MSDSNVAATSTEDPGGTPPLKTDSLQPADSTDKGKDTKLDQTVDHSKVAASAEEIKMKSKSPVKSVGGGRPAQNVNGEETAAVSSDKCMATKKRAPEKSDADELCDKTGATGADRHKSPAKTDGGGPPSVLQQQAEEAMEVDQPQGQAEATATAADQAADATTIAAAAAPAATATPKRRKRSSTGDAQMKTPANPRESPRKRTRSPSAGAGGPQSEERAKRQRRQVEKFQVASPSPEPASPSTATSVKLYDKNTTLAVRADGASFYLCRCTNPVFNTQKRFKIRWFEIEHAPDLYRLAYEDRVELECVIGPAHLQRAQRGLLRLTRPELDRIKQLIAAAEQGEDVTKLDPELFKPQTKTVRMTSRGAKDDNSSDKTVDNEGDTDTEIGEPMPRRARKRASAASSEDTPKEKPPRKARTPRTPRAARSPRMPRASKTGESGGRGGGRKAAEGGGKKVAAGTAGGARRKRMPRSVSIAQVAPPLRKTATLQLQRQGSLYRRPSLMRNLSLQRWPTVKVKGKRPKRPAGAPKQRPDPNRKLKHNPRVTVWEKDPLFESKLEVPFVSSLMHSKLAIRAVNLGDMEMLKSIMANTKEVHRVNVCKSCHSEKSTLAVAVLSEKNDFIKCIYDDERVYRARVSAPESKLPVMTTGSYNPRTLPGVKAVRKVQVSRGGKEGNNALTKDRSKMYTPSYEDVMRQALQHNTAFEVLKYMLDFSMISAHSLYSNIVIAVRYGHRHLAAQLMKESEKTEMFGFNFMHKESLILDGEDFSGKLLEASARKKPLENRYLQPIHCAAINPNTKYLALLIKLCSDLDVEDSDRRRPVHYAAACESPAPLKMLIEKGVNANTADNSGMTPLTLACITGRAENVRVILRHLIEKEKELDEEGSKPNKFGPGGVNRPMKNTWCPIHYAAANGRKDVIQVLLEMGADVDKNTGAQYNRITPLTMAAQDGDLELVRLLIKHRAKVEKPDKLKRTALIHAVRDGNAHVASYLLNLGADPNTADSSGNTALHYAAAYGWYFCMKVLLDAGAAPDPSNSWKLTPLGASYLKGNHGLTKILMDIPGVNIDFQDENGLTLLHQTVYDFPITKKTVEAVQLLVGQKNADVNIVDKQNKNAIYHLFRSNLPTENDWHRQQNMGSKKTYQEAREESEQAMREILEILLEKGCDPWVKDTSSQTIFDVTFQNHSNNTRNVALLQHVMEARPWFEDTKDSCVTGITRLHFLTSDLEDRDRMQMLQFISKMDFNGESGLNLLLPMAKVHSKSNGHTALIDACHAYRNLRRRYYCGTEAEDEYKERQAFGQEVLLFLTDELQSELEYVDTVQQVHLTVLDILLDCTQDNFEAFDLMVKRKANVDFRLKNGDTLLLKRVQQGELDRVEKLIEAGANVNLKSEATSNGCVTPLLASLRSSNVHLLKYLLDNGANRTDLKEDTRECIYHLAIRHISRSECVPVLQLLFSKDVSINSVDSQLRTPLHLAVNTSTDSPDESRSLEHFLLRKGADPFIKDVCGRMPIHYLFMKIQRREGTRAIDPVEPFSLLSIAMDKKRLDEADHTGRTALHCAALRGATVCAMLLLQNKCNINAKDKDGNTPVSLAVMKQHESCALTLMQKGADINGFVITDPLADVHPKLRDRVRKGGAHQNGPLPNNLDDEDENEGQMADTQMDVDDDSVSTILNNSRRIKKKPVWKLLPRHFPRPWQPGKTGYPIFQGLVINGWQGLVFLAMDLLEPFGMQYAEAVEIAIELCKFRFALNLMEKQLDNAKLRVKNKKGQTLLHALALTSTSTNQELQEEIVENLLQERGVNLNEQDSDGFTAFHYAILSKNWHIARQLLGRTKDIDLNLKDKYSRTPISALLWFESGRALMSQMLAGGAKADQLVDYPPLSVAHCGYMPQFHHTDYHRPYDKGDGSAGNKGGNTRVTPLIATIVRRAHEDASVLLSGGASPNFPDSLGVTPLMYAVQTADDLLVRLLLNSSLNVVHYQRSKKEYNWRLRRGDVDPVVPTEDDLFADVEPVEKTSKLDLNAVDHQGRTALHHLFVEPRYGTYEDLHILKLLVDAGAKLDAKNKEGQTPLDIALEKGAVILAKGIQALQGVARPEWLLSKPVPFVINDSITWGDGPDFDFRADAEAMRKKVEEEEEREVAALPRAVPDDRITLDNCEVVIDEEIDMPYDILMTKVDVRVGEYGLYNFYKMQVVADKKKGLYLLFTCWGRIGDRGQYQRTPFQTLEEATEEFAKIFKAKSGNEWKNVKEFEIKPKRYRLVDADYRRRNKHVEVEFSLVSKLPSKLPPYVRDLIAELCNVSMLRSTMRRTGIDVPFGRLKKDVLYKARDILHELHELAEKVAELEQSLTTENLEEYRLVCEQVAELSSEYYYLIPSSGYAFEALEPLKDTSVVASKINTLQELLELEFTGTILLGAEYRLKEINPCDYIYRAMKAKIQQLAQGTPETETIARYVFANSTLSSRDIEAIYRVEREGEPERLAACGVDTDHCLLWHGSRTSNLLSILSRGLLIAPKEAPITGFAFGKGIYTADCFGKSDGYCYNDGTGHSRFMLLCEVALGNQYQVDNNNRLPETLPPDGYNSLRANGTSVPNPKEMTILPTGVKVPLGQLTENYLPFIKDTVHQSRWLSYNEFIVYSEDQVCLRYIVQFR